MIFSCRVKSAPAFFALVVVGLVAVACGKKDSTGPDAVDGTYSIDVRYYGTGPSPAIRSSLDNAVQRLQAMITADVPRSRLNNLNLAPDSVCGVPVTINETVDDIVIFVTVKTIDGVGKTQASSGPCLVRSQGKLPVVGKMELDVDDLNQLAVTGRLDPVLVHEMLHVLGFGTIWDQVEPVRITGANGLDPRFTGPLAIQACMGAGGTTICAGGVPLENCVGIPGCGTGTRDSHWREPIFRSELMTGFIEAQNVPMPLSLMSVQSMADLGYSVNTAVADPYKIPGTALRAPSTESSAEEFPVWERMRYPGLEISESGELSRYR